jgi:hypothetical protein
MDEPKPKRSEPILSRRAIYLWVIFTVVGGFPSALTVYLNSTTRLRGIVGFMLGLPLGAIIIFLIVRGFNHHHDQKNANRPPDAP